jgi:hypothetical protein
MMALRTLSAAHCARHERLTRTSREPGNQTFASLARRSAAKTDVHEPLKVIALPASWTRGFTGEIASLRYPASAGRLHAKQPRITRL